MFKNNVNVQGINDLDIKHITHTNSHVDASVPNHMLAV